MSFPAKYDDEPPICISRSGGIPGKKTFEDRDDMIIVVLRCFVGIVVVVAWFV